MGNFTMVINNYIRSELLVVVPVLYIITKNLDSSKIDKHKIPIILMGISIVLAGIYTFATVDISTIQNFLLAIFSTLIQGVLLSGTTIFSGILMISINKVAKDKHNDENK